MTEQRVLILMHANNSMGRQTTMRHTYRQVSVESMEDTEVDDMPERRSHIAILLVKG